MQGADWRSPTRRHAALRQMERAARSSISPLKRFEMGLHPWVAFVIMPIFALANAGVRIDGTAFVDPVALAVMMGLLIGKPMGIFLFSWLAVKTGLAKLPAGVGWAAVFGGDSGWHRFYHGHFHCQLGHGRDDAERCQGRHPGRFGGERRARRGRLGDSLTERQATRGSGRLRALMVCRTPSGAYTGPSRRRRG